MQKKVKRIISNIHYDVHMSPLFDIHKIIFPAFSHHHNTIIPSLHAPTLFENSLMTNALRNPKVMLQAKITSFPEQTILLQMLPTLPTPCPLPGITVAQSNTTEIPPPLDSA
jgi:hypothetical protein